jgi:hypothetical protein
VLVVLFIFLDLVALLLATLWNLSSLLASLLARPLIFAIALLTAWAAVRLASALAALLSALLAFAITVRLIRMLFLVCHLCSPFFSNY